MAAPVSSGLAASAGGLRDPNVMSAASRSSSAAWSPVRRWRAMSLSCARSRRRSSAAVAASSRRVESAAAASRSASISEASRAAVPAACSSVLSRRERLVARLLDTLQIVLGEAVARFLGGRLRGLGKDRRGQKQQDEDGTGASIRGGKVIRPRSKGRGRSARPASPGQGGGARSAMPKLIVWRAALARAGEVPSAPPITKLADVLPRIAPPGEALR